MRDIGGPPNHEQNSFQNEWLRFPHGDFVDLDLLSSK